MTVDQRPGYEDASDLSLGEIRPVVPDLIGLGLDEACVAAAWAGIQLSARSTPRHGPVGVVVAQSPSPGTRMQPLWRIHVLVSEARVPGGSVDA